MRKSRSITTAFKYALTFIAGMLISLVIACDQLPGSPKQPQVTQYGVHADLTDGAPGFYGTDQKTKKQIYKTFDDPSMKAAQCVDASDFKKLQRYWSDFMKWVIEQINKAKAVTSFIFTNNNQGKV